MLQFSIERMIWLLCLLLAGLQVSWGQELKQRPPAETQPNNEGAASAQELSNNVPLEPITVPISVATGTPIKVALDSEVRIRKVGQPIHGKTTDPVYVFDKLVIPAGTMVNGTISRIDAVPGRTRTLDAMDGDFSPLHAVHVKFDDLVMNDGRHIAMQTVASPAPDGVLRFVSANENAANKNKVEQAASKKVSALRQQVRQQWADLQKQIHAPGKVHRLKRVAVAQLPIHPQYIEQGTSFNADLIEPLDFGSEAVKPEALTSVGTAPPSGSLVYARMVTPLSSATSKKGDPVEALITQPLVASDHLILPEGSLIKGSVVQVQPARRLGRNGQLRILFHQVAPPNGLDQKIQTSLEGVAVAKGQHLKLDAEGGAQVTTPKTRYLTTGIQIMLAASQASPDRDAGRGADGGSLGGSAATGASGFRFVGMIASLAAQSRIVSAGFGGYGAATSIYYHFLARGRDVVYPKDMAMAIGMGTRESKPAATPASRNLEKKDLEVAKIGLNNSRQ
ncbi:MAG TPA: hypothetical protein VI386_24715 [Candidatus Sulfotelmatobacter sp.]